MPRAYATDSPKSAPANGLDSLTFPSLPDGILTLFLTPLGELRPFPLLVFPNDGSTTGSRRVRCQLRLEVTCHLRSSLPADFTHPLAPTCLTATPNLIPSALGRIAPFSTTRISDGLTPRPAPSRLSPAAPESMPHGATRHPGPLRTPLHARDSYHLTPSPLGELRPGQVAPSSTSLFLLVSHPSSIVASPTRA